MAEELEVGDFQGPFQPKPFYDSMNKSREYLLKVCGSGNMKTLRPKHTSTLYTETVNINPSTRIETTVVPC